MDTRLYSPQESPKVPLGRRGGVIGIFGVSSQDVESASSPRTGPSDGSAAIALCVGYLLDDLFQWSPTKFELHETGIQVESGSSSTFVHLSQVTNLFEEGEAIDDYLPVEIVQTEGPNLRVRLSPAFLDSLLEVLVRSLDGNEPKVVTPEDLIAPPVFVPPADVPQQTEEQLINLRTVEYVDHQSSSAQDEFVPAFGEPALSAEVATTVRTSPICPYCQSPVDGSSATCESCHAVHHEDCWAESEGCSVTGCTQSQAASLVAATAVTSGSGALTNSVVAGTGGWGSSTTAEPIAPGVEFGATAATAPHEFSARPKRKRVLRTLLVVVLLIGLPILAVFGTVKNWWEPITGHMYSEEELVVATDTAESEGYDSGKSDGYDEGEAAGYTSGKSAGYDEGKTAGYAAGYASGVTDGCTSVFEAVDSYIVYSDSNPFSYSTIYYLGKSSCYG